MDLAKFSSKLVGSDDERAVSPVIGVILMVAITVILAAVIAAFVLDMGDSMGSEPVNAVVEIDVDDGEEEVTITLTDSGNADHFNLTGEDDAVDDDAPHELGLDGVGESVTIASGETPIESDADGEIRVVAVSNDGAESVVGTESIDFSS